MLTFDTTPSSGTGHFCHEPRAPDPCTEYPMSHSVEPHRVCKAKRSRAKRRHKHLSVGLGDTLQLVLLLDGIRVAASLGSVDQLFGQALSNALDVTERGLAGT